MIDCVIDTKLFDRTYQLNNTPSHKYNVSGSFLRWNENIFVWKCCCVENSI